MKPTSILLLFCLVGSILLGLPGGAAAGTAYTAAVGNPPVITRLAWKTWYTRLLAFRQAECHTVRTTTYYFAANGSDYSGTGTVEAPYQTIAKAQSLLAANVRLRFRRGDTFRSYPAAGVPAIDITNAHVTLDDYGSTADPKPILSRFNAPYTIWNWSLTEGTADGRCWQAAENAPISWLREAGVVTNIYRKMTSIATVDATPGSWWQDTAAHLIYVNPTGNTAFAASPASGGRLFESVTANTNTGIRFGYGVSVDDILLQNLRLDGWTANIADAGGDSIHGYNTGTDAALLRGVDVFYSDRHCIVNTSASGGITTLLQCKYGWTTSPTSGAGTVVYALAGGQEALWHECESWGDMLPTGATPYPDATYNDAAQLAHTGSEAGQICALFIAYGCSNRPGQWQAGVGSNCAAPVIWTDLADCRAFVVGETFDAREITPLDASASRPSTNSPGKIGFAGSDNVVHVNCKFNARIVWADVVDNTDYDFLTSASLGFLINCTLICDAGAAYNTHWGGARNLTWAGAGQVYNCRIHIKTTGNSSRVFGSQVVQNNPTTGSTNIKLYNSIFGAEGVGLPPYNYFAPGLGNIAANQINNAYSNASSAHKSQAEGYDQDPFYVEVSDLAFGHPGLDSPLRTTHNQWVQGQYRLEYDADWTLRSLATPAIGPYEPVQPVMVGGRRF